MLSGGGPGGKFGSMNLTPLIDVLLTLLVIFMIITPVTSLGEKALIPQPPPKNSKPQKNNRSVVLQVSAGPGGQPLLEINQHSVNWPDLTQQLTDIYETRAEKVLFIKADDDVPWQDVAAVIDTAHLAGVDKVGLITAKIEAGG
jgi:biopolymer transport protein TolR